MRQLLNVAYSFQAEHMTAEEEEDFQERIGMRRDPEQWAKEQLAAHQEAVGMTFTDPDAPVAPDAKAQAYMADQEIDGNYMGSGRRGQ